MKLPTPDPIKLGVMGIDHGHIFGMLQNMAAIGCTCSHWWSAEKAVTQDKFQAVFPDLTQVDNYGTILDDPDVNMVLISAIPADRADLAIAAMEAGKDVMVDKPGCT
ncbi:MAG: Gfo/Idh/MocA family oxidoreductase, partial [Pseudomonadota bacterium]